MDFLNSILAVDPTIWDGISGFVTDNSPLLTTALLAVFGIPVIFALYKLAKRALGKV